MRESFSRELEDLTTTQDMGEERYQILQDIHRMTDRALTQAESELEDNSIAQNDGVLVQTFIPLMTRYVHLFLTYMPF